MREDIGKVVWLWDEFGIKPAIRGKVRYGTKRYGFITARIKEEGIDEVLEVVRKRAESPFLCNPPTSGKYTGVVFNLEWCMRPNNFVKIQDGNYDKKGGTVQSKIHYGEHSGSDILWAGQCARRRGLNDDRMDREQLFEIYNQDIGTCQNLAREKGLDTTGMTPSDLFRWYQSETGRWPHE
jgi:hypothetical protein